MIYLDYSATTPPNEEILESFNKINRDFIGNANSLHKLGLEANKLIEKSSEQIANILHIQPKEIIYTSSASESNNLAIKGIAFKYQNRGKHIITTRFEHSSVYGALNFLEKLGYEITYLNGNVDGIIEVEELKKAIRDDTILVAISHVNSELGLVQPVEIIGEFLKNYPKCYFLVDLTQSIGKINVDLTNIDLATISGHKIYGLKGISCLIKKEKVELEPLIHGGKSTTDYRSGTPAHPLIASLAKAMRLATTNVSEKYAYVLELNNFLRQNLQKYEDVVINSNEFCLPHILNVSILNVKAETFMHALESYGVYISTKSACNDKDSLSPSVYALTNDLERSQSSLRISLSHLTTKEELRKFLAIFEECYHKLKM